MFFFSEDKMVMMLRWINEYCSSESHDLQKYVLFVDDDYFIDLPSLLLFTNKVDEDSEMTPYKRRTFITGHLYPSSHPRRFINDRWYISMNDYPYDQYPPYVTAGCFLMTRSSARLFYLASKYTHLFRFDDIYIGLLAYSMSIDLIPNNDLFSAYVSPPIMLNNQENTFTRWIRNFFNKNHLNSTKKTICIHGYRGEKLIQVWNQIHQTNLTISVN